MPLNPMSGVISLPKAMPVKKAQVFFGARPDRHHEAPVSSELHVGRFIGAPTTLTGQYPLNAPTKADMQVYMKSAKVTWPELDALERFLVQQGYQDKSPRNVWNMMIFVMNTPQLWRHLLKQTADRNSQDTENRLSHSGPSSDSESLRTTFRKLDRLFSLGYRQNNSVVTVPAEDVVHGRYAAALLDTTTPPLRIYRGRRNRPHPSDTQPNESFLAPSSNFTVPYFLEQGSGHPSSALAEDGNTRSAPAPQEPPKRGYWLMRLMAPFIVKRPVRSSESVDKTSRFPLVIDAINDRLHPSLRVQSRSLTSPIVITPALGKPVRLMPDAPELEKVFVTPEGPSGHQPILIEIDDDQHNMYVTAQPLDATHNEVTRTQWLIKGYPKA